MGRAKVWRRPVTRMTSIPWAWARPRVARSVPEIWNSGLSRVPSISMAMRRRESAVTSNFNIGCNLAFRVPTRPRRRAIYEITCTYETTTPSSVPDFVANLVAGSARARNRQAFRGRILLQGEVGTCGRVSAAVQEEPLSAAEETSRDGPHAQGLDGPAALPYDRRRALGLSRDH